MAPRRTSSLLLLLYSLSFLCISLWLSAHVSRTVPQPYMDEEFHVGQTQTYCAGRWTEWHPKITTLPGLYVTAVPYAQALGALSQQHLPSPSSTNNSTENAAAAIKLCSVAVLRSLNVVYAVLCIPLYFALLRTLHPSLSPFRSLLATVQLSVFPLCFFFAFLFYTDLASVFWTLTAYLCLLRGHRFLAAVLSACAVFMRQTNVAWVGFMLLTEIVHAWQQGDATLFGEKHARAVAAGEDLRKHLASGGHAPSQAHDGEKEGKIALESLRCYHAPAWADVPRALVSLVVDCLRALPSLLVRYVGLLLVLASFVLFVRWNGGIVVGDRDNHLFHAHWPQMLYFLAFTAGFTALNWISPSTIPDVAANITRYPLASVAVAGMMAAAVHFFTMAHPFLLADNRHYPFYVWKNLFRRFAPAKYLFVPAYLVCATVMQRAWSGERAQSRLFQLLFWTVTALCLVPTPLLEPRYFLTPFLLWFLHSAPRLIESVPRSCVAIAVYVAINAATLYVFLRRPFTWNDGSEARFMW